MSHRKLKFLKARKVAAAAATLGAVGIPAATASAATAPHVDSANTVEMQAVKVNTASYHHHKADTGNITYKVVPGDNLFDIAKVHLGDGDKWTEIYDANKGHAETDNRGNVQSFDNPDFIRPGWLLSVTSAPGRGWMSGPQDGSPSSGSGQQDGSPTPSPSPTQSSGHASDSPDSPNVSSVVTQWHDTIVQAMGLVGWNPDEIVSGFTAVNPQYGYPGAPEWATTPHDATRLQAIEEMMMLESGGDSTICNNSDSNAANGTPSCGLMQVIQPTFDAYHVSGTSNSLTDPLANIAAALSYIDATYGGRPPGSPY